MKNFKTTSLKITTYEKNELVNAILELQVNRKISVKKISFYDISKRFHLENDFIDIAFTYQGNLLRLSYYYDSLQNCKVINLYEYDFTTKNQVRIDSKTILLSIDLLMVKYSVMNMLDKQYGQYTE